MLYQTCHFYPVLFNLINLLKLNNSGRKERKKKNVDLLIFPDSIKMYEKLDIKCKECA